MVAIRSYLLGMCYSRSEIHLVLQTYPCSPNKAGCSLTLLAVGTQAAAGELIAEFTELVEFTEGNLPASNKGEEM